MIKRVVKTALIALVLAGFVPSGYALSPEELALNIAAGYKGVEDIRANFTQTSTMGTVGIERVTGGKVAFKRGGRMRWDYEGDDPQQIISDGEYLWFYQIRDRSVIRRPIAALTPAARVMLEVISGLSKADEHFELSNCGDSCLALTPKVSEPDIERVEVGVDENFRIKSVTTINGLGNTTMVTLSEAKINPGLEDDYFEFTLPEGVDIFDGEGGDL
ncbi:MAG: outer membrane lipoprotein carrier protein LolA [Deltaproteobacteria bacterium]|nr:MAG: outer membrane lipoprotein carrier protein LolA [Deltaproteobacteria bacterium]